MEGCHQVALELPYQQRPNSDNYRPTRIIRAIRLPDGALLRGPCLNKPILPVRPTMSANEATELQRDASAFLVAERKR